MSLASDRFGGGRGQGPAADQRVAINDATRTRGFWRTLQHLQAGEIVKGAPEGRGRTVILMSGWLAEARILQDGRRQIFSFLVPGDVADLGAASDLGDHGLIALTNAEIADVGALGADDHDWLQKAANQRESRIRDHLVRVGKLSATERVLSLLVELHDRLTEVGMVKDGAFRTPLTQEILADALGLSVVHVNRTLQRLRHDGALMLNRGKATVLRRDRPERLAS